MNKRKQDENKMKKEDSRGMVRIRIWRGKCSGRKNNAETGCGHDGGREEKERSRFRDRLMSY